MQKSCQPCQNMSPWSIKWYKKGGIFFGFASTFGGEQGVQNQVQKYSKDPLQSRSIEKCPIHQNYFLMVHMDCTSLKVKLIAKGLGILSNLLVLGAKHTDYAPEEVLAMVHPHWTQFEPQHPFIQHFCGIIFFLLWFFSSIGNGLVIYIFLK